MGFLSGIFYFGGLWLTLRYINQVRYAIILTLLSYVVRTAIVFLIILFIVRLGQWASILVWLVGFVLSRIILSRSLKVDHLENNSTVLQGPKKKSGEGVREK